MVQFYILQIRMGKMTLEDVPALWADEVKNAIEALPTSEENRTAEAD